MSKETISNIDVRANNKKRLIHLIFRTGQMTKQELSSQLGISQPTVATILNELAEAGLIVEGNVMDSTGGRKAQCHNPVKDAKFSIGVDVSNDTVRIVTLNLGSEIVAKDECPISFNYTDDNWKEINQFIHSFVDENNIDEDKLLEIGITLNAPMSDDKIVNYEGMNVDINLDAAKDFFDYSVQFRNNAKMAAMAQVWGATRKENFIFLRLGESVQGAMVHEGLSIDFSKINGEVGQMHLGGPKSPCINDLVSTTVLDKIGVKHAHDFIDKVRQGDEECAKILETYLDDISCLIFNLYSIFGWEVIIGGKMSYVVDEYKEQIKERLKDYYFLVKPEGELFSISEFGSMGAAVGAALLPIDRFLSTI